MARLLRAGEEREPALPFRDRSLETMLGPSQNPRTLRSGDAIVSTHPESTQSLKSKTARGVVVVAMILVVVTACVLVIIFREMRRNGHCEVVLDNVPTGLRVRAVASHNPSVAHEGVIAGHRLAKPRTVMTRQSLPADVGATLFFDETRLPGRWTFTVDGIEVDLMESRMEIRQ